jgi:universal stress protein E
MGAATASVPTWSLENSLRDAVTDTHEEAFEVLAERYDIEENRHLLTGIPHTVISHFVRLHGFDMVVLGTTYQHGIDRFIGSTAESVLNRAPCSLTIVKPLSRLDPAGGQSCARLKKINLGSQTQYPGL